MSNLSPTMTLTLTVIVQVVPSSPQADNQGGQIYVFLTRHGHCGKEGRRALARHKVQKVSKVHSCKDFCTFQQIKFLLNIFYFVAAETARV